MLIGEVAERSGVSARMLRHYDRTGVLRPSGRTAGGYRHYSAADLRRLFCVELLRSLGLRTREVVEALADPDFDPVPLVDRLVAETRARLDRDTELLRRLTLVRAGNPASWDDVLRTTALVRGLGARDASARQRAVLEARQSAAGTAALLAEAVLTEDDPNVAGALRWALARTGEGSVPLLRAALGSEVPTRRHRALETLASLGSPAAHAALRDALTHADAVVAGRAALALGRAGDPAVVPVLVSLVVSGRDDVEAAQLLGALAQEHDLAAAVHGALADALDPAAPDVRRRLVAALADVPGPAARSTLRRLLGDDDRGVALTAKALLARDDPDPADDPGPVSRS